MKNMAIIIVTTVLVLSLFASAGCRSAGGHSKSQNCPKSVENGDMTPAGVYVPNVNQY